MPQYLYDEKVPTIECCGVQYYWEDHEDEEQCLICGEQFDWVECASHWNPEDYEVVDEDDSNDSEELFRNHHSYRGSFLGNDGEEYEQSLFKGYSGKHRTPEPTRKTDVFLDKEIPDEVL